MTPQERKLYRAIGGRLAVLLRERRGEQVRPAALQAIAADLLGNKTELLLPLKELVSRPGFQLLMAKAGSGSGVLERSALLADLERTFSPAVMTALHELLGGFLDLPTTSYLAPAEGGNARALEARKPKKENVQKQTTDKIQKPLSIVLSACAATATIAALGMMALRNQRVCEALALCERIEQESGAKPSVNSERPAVADQELTTRNRPRPIGLGEAEVAEATATSLKSQSKNSNSRTTQDPKIRSMSPEEEAVSLVKEKVPVIRQRERNGKQWLFRQEDQLDDCTIILRAYQDLPLHMATLGWYKVDLCNENVEDITSKPNAF